GRWIRRNLMLFTNAMLSITFLIILIGLLRYTELRSEEQRRATENYRLASSAFERMSDAAFRSVKAIEQPELKARLESRRNLESETSEIVNQYNEDFIKLNGLPGGLRIIKMRIDHYRPRPSRP